MKKQWIAPEDITGILFDGEGLGYSGGTPNKWWAVGTKENPLTGCYENGRRAAEDGDYAVLAADPLEAFAIITGAKPMYATEYIYLVHCRATRGNPTRAER